MHVRAVYERINIVQPFVDVTKFLCFVYQIFEKIFNVTIM